MGNKKGKTTDSLMRHIRDSHNIEINGSRDKENLEKMGYFHGYKAYKFVGNESNTIDVKKFSDIKHVYDFDTVLKSIFYPIVTQLETILKNYTISEIVSNDSIDLNNIFRKYLTNEKEIGNRQSRKKAISKKLKLRMKVNSTIFYNYKNSSMFQHYLNNSKQVPLWALFEKFSLGTYGMFVQCLNSKYRLNIQKKIGTINPQDDTKGSHLAKHIFIIEGLRNAVAHNNIVFDCRFRTFKPKENICKSIEKETEISNINFTHIVDYLILILIYYKKMGTQKTIMKRNVKDFQLAIKNLKKDIDISIYQKILGSDVEKKCNKLIEYVKK